MLKRAFTPKKDSKGKEYYDTILTIKTILPDGRESYDNYGGLREYSDGYWNSKKSAFGKLQALMVEEFGIKNRQEMIRKLSNAKVKIRTEKTTFNGNEYYKNVIKSFREWMGVSVMDCCRCSTSLPIFFFFIFHQVIKLLELGEWLIYELGKKA